MEITRRLFPLSEKREDTGIAGLSMGGYGAVVNGLMHPETFGSIGMLSAALIQERVINSTFEEPMPLFNRRYYQEIYKDIDAIKGSELDYQQQISKMAKAGQTIPNFFICCGEEDVACINDARNYHALLEELGIAHHYHEGPGGHDWNYWDENLAKLLAWFTQTK
ncbi:enterobactin/ferric enterobactin esterase [Clostridiales bacterium CHKCI006]|nr:enterobactin/ferric enterobactin esterase [Clostridiales bacterium CHKCI006]